MAQRMQKVEYPAFAVPTRVATLPTEIKEQVDRRFLKGDTPYSVTTWLQKQEYWSDIAYRTALNTLTKYRDRYFEIAKTKEQLDIEARRQAQEALREALPGNELCNVFAAYTELIEIQQSRLKKLLDKEQKDGKPIADVDVALRTQATLLKGYGTMAYNAGILKLDALRYGDKKEGDAERKLLADKTRRKPLLKATKEVIELLKQVKES